MRPLRVALTLTQCWHRVPGGTATSALGLARALAQRPDVEVVGVAPRHRRPPAPAFAPPVPTRSLPLPRVVLYDAWHHLAWPPVEVASGPVDVVHATQAVVPPRGRAPLVVTVHDLLPLDHPGGFTRRGARVMGRGLALARERADLVLCPSRATAADAARHGFPPERLRVVPWGVEPVDEAGAATARRRVALRYGLTRPYVLWVGTVEPRKGLPVLLEAHRRLERADVDLVLVGAEGWHEDLDALLRGAVGRVRRLGFVPGDDLTGLYAGAAAFCYPSRAEGFGLPVLEAMAAGAPVVTSAGTATEEAAGGAALLVDPADADAVAAALARVLDDAGEADRLRLAGRQRAAAASWGACAEATVAAYREVAG